MRCHWCYFACLFLLLCSSPALAQFTLLYPPISSDPLDEIVFVDSLTGLFTNAAGTIFKTTDGGQTWYLAAHYQGDPITIIRFVNPALGFGASPYAGLWLDKNNCVFTTNGGNHWDPADIDLSDASDLLPFSASIVIKGCTPGIKRLDNLFGIWTQTYQMPWYIAGDVGSPYGTVRQFFRFSDNNVLALVSFENAKRDHIKSDSLNVILHSGNQGSSWDTLWSGLTTLVQAMDFANDSVGWMGGYDGTILKTVDGGRHWMVQWTDSVTRATIRQVKVLDTLLVFAAGTNGWIFRTSDGGGTWSSILVDSTGGWNSEVRKRIAFPDRLHGYYAGSELFRTGDGGLTWQPVFQAIREEALHMEFLNRQLGWVLTDRGFYASTDGGHSWNERSEMLTFLYFDMIDSLTGWAVSPTQRAKTTDGGFTWSRWDFDPRPNWVRGVQFYDKNLGVIFEVLEASNTTSNLVTTDGGNTWTRYPITSPRFPSSWSKVKFTGPDHLWFSNQQGLWHSRDSAKTWSIRTADSIWSTATFDVQDTLRAMCDVFPNVLAATYDGGLSWTRYQKPYGNASHDLAILGHTYSGVRSSLVVGEEGSIFQEDEDGMPMFVYDSYTLNPLSTISVYREGSSADVWVLGSGFEILHAVFEFPDAVTQPQGLPEAYRLFQNYPNPFNPRTVIRSQTPEASEVRIVIYDVLGREVKVLANERRAAGRYEDTFDASGLASGVYIYRMTAGGFTQTEKMILVK